MNPSDDFEPMLQRYLDGAASSEEIARLDERLRADPAARQRFSELLNLDSALAESAAAWAAERDERASIRPRVFLAIRWSAIAASLAAAGLFWFWQARPPAGSPIETSAPFATVVAGAGAAELANGAAVGAERVELKAGTVELLTYRGARVVIEAPAAFRFESAQRLRMLHGRLAANVPPAAKGFTILTPTGTAIDLGTQFGVDVPRQGLAEIHVFEGEVIAQSSQGGARQSLRQGEAFALQAGAGESREMRSAAFIRPDEVADLSAGLAAGQHARSDAANGLLRRDPALIALLDFESDAKAEGSYRVVQGRWPGSHAAEFVRVGDRMKLDIGGEHAWPRFTLAAWVRIDRLGEPYQSLYHTDGWYNSDKPGQVHWMINRDTTMRLALLNNTLPAGSEDRHGFPDSRTSVLPERGRWVHLAVVYDSTARTVRFYLNGEFDKESIQEVAHPARFGPAQIGNWDSKDRKLSGRVDEFLMLGRALSDDEIQALYHAGTPYPTPSP